MPPRLPCARRSSVTTSSKTGQRAERGDDLARRRMEPQHGAGDEAEGAFRADEDLLQVVARIVLQHLVERGDDGPVGQHGLEAQHLLARHAVADDADAAGIGGEIAADLAGAARAEIEREEEPGFGRGLLAGLERRSGLHRHGGRGRVDLLDAGEAFEADDDLAAGRIAAAREARHAALRDDGLARGMAEPQGG